MDELALVPQNITAVQLFTENGLDPILGGIRKMIDEFVPDVETAKGRKEIASFAHKISRSKTFIDDAGKTLVEKQKAEIKLVDSERKRSRDTLDAWKVEVRKPLTDYEEAEKARIEAEALEAQRQSDWDAAIAENNLFDRQREIERKEAELAKAEAERKAKEEADRLEKERIEREERLKKETAEREERLKKEAAEHAKREAEAKIREAEERLERERTEAKRKEEAAKEAALKAERDKIAAEERAKIEKEIAIRKATEEAEARAKAQKEAEERETARIRAEEEKKAANKKHQAAVNNGIKAELVKLGVQESVAIELITAIAKGKIDRLYIQY